jgi:hypothetical protein
VLAPKQKDAPKEEPSENSPVKTVPSAKAKRKLNGDDAKAVSSGAPPKKVKTENVRLSFMNLLYFTSSFYSNHLSPMVF